MSLILGPSIYEVNSIKKVCEYVPLSKAKPIPIVFICLKEGPLGPTSIHAQGPQLNVSKILCIKIFSNSGVHNLTSRHDSLNLKGSAESGEKND